ncbi:hypothetical protein FE257_005082 [Aspergillus nanangensis]|uniref:Uncharacterized protein n=1 Tax=Aspergillus nanangensis TaxID=2582783 RepID=A0AAD4GVU0_ASPNN|nr:hypothetical protein FE257_005082 [Aspergillus nanangensis]
MVYAPAMVKRQAFRGTLGGAVPAITKTGDADRPYAVDGDTFTDYASAAERSCNNQFDTCQRLANTDTSVSYTLQDCQDQLTTCMTINSSTETVEVAAARLQPTSTTGSDSGSNTVVAGPLAQTTIPYDDEFDLVCDL